MPVCRFCDEDVPAGLRHCPACGAELPPMEISSEAPNLEQELLDLIGRGETLGAIKHYRDATGAGLAEAKSAIETLASTRSLPERGATAATDRDVALETEILNLVSQGKKIEAVKVYRERRGVGLKDAKEAVEGLAVRHGVASKSSGCLGMVLLMVGAVALLACV